MIDWSKAPEWANWAAMGYKAPEWANWAAMGSDGEWFWFYSEPISEDDAWWSNDAFARVGFNGLGLGHWRDSLHRRPAPEPRPSEPEQGGTVSAYEELYRILMLAYDQAARGKGAVRHADGKPWHEQPIITTTQAVGYGFPAGQAMKKIGEARGMMDRGETQAAIQELLGAITYTAAAVLYLEGKG